VTAAIIKGVMNMIYAASIRNTLRIAYCHFFIASGAKAMAGIPAASKSLNP